MGEKKRIVAMAVVVGAVIVVAVVLKVMGGGSELEVDGTITHVDPAANEATLSFMSPTKRIMIEKTATIPPECQVTLNGKPATIHDVKAGDKAKVLARWYKKEKKFELLRVNVDRAETSPESAPASAPAS